MIDRALPTRKEPTLIEGVPEAHQQAAEEIRAHLVMLRGGALFLSPADAARLVDWLEDGVKVSSILRALERAAEARRKRRSRIPFGLAQANRHLGRPTAGGIRPTPAGHPLAPLAETLAGPATAELADTLVAIDVGDPEAAARAALGAIRAFFDARWRALPLADRERWLLEARDELGEIGDLLDEAGLQRAIEELARDRLRLAHPTLTAATVWELLSR